MAAGRHGYARAQHAQRRRTRPHRKQREREPTKHRALGKHRLRLRLGLYGWLHERAEVRGETRGSGVKLTVIFIVQSDEGIRGKLTTKPRGAQGAREQSRALLDEASWNTL